MALSPPHSAAPPGILPPSVLSVSFGGVKESSIGNGQKIPIRQNVVGELQAARDENRELRAAIARVNETTPLFPYQYETETKVILHGCDADAAEINVPAGPLAKPVHVRDCHGGQNTTVMRIAGNPGVLIIELSSNLRIVSHCREEIVLSGCESIELVLGVNPPRVTLIACKMCVVVVPKESWRNAVNSIGCTDISVLAIEVGATPDGASERILLPDMLRTAVRQGNMATQCDFAADDVQPPLPPAVRHFGRTLHDPLLTTQPAALQQTPQSPAVPHLPIAFHSENQQGPPLPLSENGTAIPVSLPTKDSAGIEDQQRLSSGDPMGLLSQKSGHSPTQVRTSPPAPVAPNPQLTPSSSVQRHDPLTSAQLLQPTSAGHGSSPQGEVLCGVGMLVERHPGRCPTVDKVVPEGPAGRDGTVQPGHELLAVDGVSVVEMDLQAVAALLRGPTGVPVTLKLRRPPSYEYAPARPDNCMTKWIVVV